MNQKERLTATNRSRRKYGFFIKKRHTSLAVTFLRSNNRKNAISFLSTFSGDSICQDVTFGTTTRCNIAFCYDGFEDGEVRLTASTECITMAGVKIISAAVLVFLATILLGAIIIIISKIRLHRLEKAEYKRFIDEQRLNSEMNPLYKSPYVEYKNPLHSE